MADEVKQYTHQNFAGIATSSGTKTSHSITILNGDNKTIGMIHSWQASRNRTVTRIHELNANTAGQAVDLVPGVVGTDQITISRYALWKSDLFYAIGESKDGSKVFGGTPGSVKDMLQQRQPFEIREVWATPSNNGIAKDGSEDQALKSSLSPEEIKELIQKRQEDR